MLMFVHTGAAGTL